MKHLRRNPNWVDCETKNCDFGWVWLQSDKTKEKRLECAACKKIQTIKKEKEDVCESKQQEKMPSDASQPNRLSDTWKCTNNACKHKNAVSYDWCKKCGQTWSCASWYDRKIC